MNDLLLTTIATLLPALLTAAAGYLFARFRQTKKEIVAVQLGLQAMLRDRIIQAYNHYVCTKHWIPIYAKDSVMACYRSYEALGTNGVINDLIREIRELPNAEPTEEKKHE